MSEPNRTKAEVVYDRLAAFSLKDMKELADRLEKDEMVKTLLQMAMAVAGSVPSVSNTSGEGF